MKRNYLTTFLGGFLTFLIGLSCAFAQQGPAAAAPAAVPAAGLNQPSLMPSPPDLKAKAYVLMDADSGTILAQENMDEKLPPASLTKLMTLYLSSAALKNGTIQLDTQVPVSKQAWQMGGSKMFVRVGNNVSVKDLLQGIIVDSGNDACVAMAEFISGNEESFVKMMNEQAQLLGLKNTHYVDCTGLQEPKHYTTAYDLAVLARAIILDFPEYYGWYKQKWFKYNGIKQPNRNRLLWRYPDADGLKTGHTSAAGYCLVSSAVKNNMRLIAVVLGASSDEQRSSESVALLNYGFRFYHSQLVYPAGKVIASPRVWYGTSKTAPVGVQQDLVATMPIAQKAQLKTKIILNESLKAPIKQGQVIGKITAMLDDKVVTSAPLVAFESNAEGGLWRRAYDSVVYWIYGWMK